MSQKMVKCEASNLLIALAPRFRHRMITHSRAEKSAHLRLPEITNFNWIGRSNFPPCLNKKQGDDRCAWIASRPVVLLES